MTWNSAEYQQLAKLASTADRIADALERIAEAQAGVVMTALPVARRYKVTYDYYGGDYGTAEVMVMAYSAEEAAFQAMLEPKRNHSEVYLSGVEPVVEE